MRLRAEDRAAADVVRRAGRALSRPAGALLTIGLLIAAADLAACLGVSVALAPIDELRSNDLVQKAYVDRRSKHIGVELVLTDNIAVHIVDIRGGHLRLLHLCLRRSSMPPRRQCAWQAPVGRRSCVSALPPRWDLGWNHRRRAGCARDRLE